MTRIIWAAVAALLLALCERVVRMENTLLRLARIADAKATRAQL